MPVQMTLYLFVLKWFKDVYPLLLGNSNITNPRLSGLQLALVLILIYMNFIVRLWEHGIEVMNIGFIGETKHVLM